jgi:aerobic carbon-monoxide dehydrogenase medium subunit
MKPAPFAYCRPATLADALDALARHADARILAGGQSLMPALNMRLATPRAVIDINRLPGLDAIRVAADGLVIGALARHEALERSPLVREHAPLLTLALPHVGHAAIRTRGTLGGSLALADPAAELPACVVALDARIRVEGRIGRREIAAADFFRGVYTTALEPGELVTEVVFPAAAGWRSGFQEVARRHGDFALAGLAARARVEGGAPVRARATEAALTGRRADAGVIDTARRALAGELDPPGDVHGSPALRRHLAGVLLARVVAPLGEARA